MGEEHAPHGPPSSLHSNEEAASLDTKRKLASCMPVGEVGADVIVVSGGVRSTRKVCGELVPVLPALSDCCAWTV